MLAIGSSPLDLQAFQRIFPLPPFLKERPERLVEWLWHYDLEVSASELWPYVTDTSRINDLIGYPEMTFTERDGQLYGSSLWDGVAHEWLEVPWDFSYPYSMVCTRKYTRGVVSYYHAVYFAEDFFEEGACRVYIYLGWVLRTERVRKNFCAYFDQKEADYGRVLQQLQRNLSARLPDPRLKTPERIALTEDAKLRLEVIRAHWIQKVGDDRLETVDRMLTYIVSADDLDLYRIKLIPLAARWQMPPRDLLKVALFGVQAGALTMSWDVICPHCRGVREELSSLAALPSRGFCEICLIDFDTSGVNGLEIVFHVHPALRKVKKRWFCSAEPATRPHIKIQQTVEPRESRDLQSALETGQYRLRRKGESFMSWLEVQPDAQTNRLEWRSSDQNPLNVVGPHPALILRNESSAPQTFIIEDIHWPLQALRPADLFNLQQFREIFPAESVSPDLFLEVGEQTILFTDVVNSTGFYLSRGDGEAFGVIRDHFQVLYQIADFFDGGVIKTIGDSAMMAFASPSRAFAAASRIAREFGNASANIQLRLAMNTGPCIAVRLNSGIDYFGQTVNYAAKLLRAVEGGQVALSEASFQAVGSNDAHRKVQVEVAGKRMMACIYG
ncbi:MAG: adenylate/guanylate cyclase domain-containing protein [Spirochaetales bacterium]|nr:adenylate/guanylate cyclase domain-containing protein [Spirochaetales bacterium]